VLTIPDPDEPCSYLAFEGGLGLEEPQFEELLRSLDTTDKGLHASIFRQGTPREGQYFSVAERFGLDVRDSRGGASHAGGIEQGTELPFGIVHFDVDAHKVPYDPEAREDVGDAEKLERFWTWVQTQADVDVWVRATLRFETSAYRPVVSLPLKAPPGIGVFDSIPGLVLAKSEGSGEDQRLLYEVTVRQRRSDQILVYPQFRRRLTGTNSMLIELIQSATEIGKFAVVPLEQGGL
jgi:hypothetical protein